MIKKEDLKGLPDFKIQEILENQEKVTLWDEDVNATIYLKLKEGIKQDTIKIMGLTAELEREKILVSKEGEEEKYQTDVSAKNLDIVLSLRMKFYKEAKGFAETIEHFEKILKPKTAEKKKGAGAKIAEAMAEGKG